MPSLESGANGGHQFESPNNPAFTVHHVKRDSDLAAQAFSTHGAEYVYLPDPDFRSPLLSIFMRPRQPLWELSHRFSRVSEADKYTTNLDTCVALIVAGRKPSGEQVSALGHLSPMTAQLIGIRRDTRLMLANFRHEFRAVMNEIKEITVPGTRRAGLAGGLYLSSAEEPDLAYLTDRNFKREYQQLFLMLHYMLMRHMQIRPNLLAPPKRGIKKTDFYYRTQERTAIVVE